MTGNRSPHFSSNASSSAWAWSGSIGGVDRLQVPGDLLALPPGDVFQAWRMRCTMQVCTVVLREDRLDRLGEPVEPVDAADQDVPDAALLELGRTCIQNFAPSVSWNHRPSTSRSPSSVIPSAR